MFGYKRLETFTDYDVIVCSKKSSLVKIDEKCSAKYSCLVPVKSVKVNQKSVPKYSLNQKQFPLSVKKNETNGKRRKEDESGYTASMVILFLILKYFFSVS